MGIPTATVEEHAFRGDPALTLRSAGTSATFLPGLGMTGVSLRHRGREHLALPGGLDRLRAHHTLGLPLLAPWANRLSGRSYRVGRTAVDLTGLPLPTDGNGLPIHGFLVGSSGWHVQWHGTRGGRAALRASRDVDAVAFPFPHRIELDVAVDEARLRVDTTIVPTGRRRVPVAFGWHPYLRVAGPRRTWRLRLPARRHLLLDDRGIPTGEARREPAEDAPIGRRHLDDLYALGRVRTLGLVGEDGAGIELRCGSGYTCSQVWVPPGKRYAALEPMAAPTNALVERSAPLVEPGDAFRARFELVLIGG